MARQTVRVFNSSSEKLADVNPANLELMEEFLEYYESDHSDKSVKVVRSNLNIFFVWVKDNLNNKDFADIKKRDLLKYQNYLSKQGLSPARIRALRSAVSSLSNFIEDILDEDEKWENFKNITNKIKAPKLVHVRKKTIMTDEQVQATLDKLVETGRVQQACALAIAWSSGRRKAELLRIKVSDIVDDNLSYGCLYQTDKIKTKGMGKLGKQLNVYILKSKFKPYFDLWMEKRRELGVPDNIEEMFIDFDEDGNIIPCGEARLNSYANTISDISGVDFYWHCLRHNFTTELLRQGIPAEVVKEIVGWESVDMVSVYDDRDLTESLGNYFSEDGIKQVEKKSLADL